MREIINYNNQNTTTLMKKINPILAKNLEENMAFINQCQIDSLDDLKNLADTIWEENHREYNHQAIITYLNSIELIPDGNVEDEIMNFDFEEYLLENHITPESVDAEVDPHKGYGNGSFRGTVSAECPHCETSDGIVINGEFSDEDSDVVKCGICGNYVEIHWNINNNTK